ncbi:MAG: RNA-guided endonuclease TnpB family protein, partial [Nanoarchaeota archaeon]
MQRTIGLQISKEPELLNTIQTYNQIVNEHITKSFELKTNSKNKLHKALYKEIRQKFPDFPSALIQCARDNAVEMLKGNKYKQHTKKRLDSSIRFDLRTAKVFLNSGQLQITTIEGRKKYNIKIPDYFAKYSDWKVKAVSLGNSKKMLKLKVIAEGEFPKQSINKDIIGIDLGIKNFVVLSNGTFIKPNKIRAIKRNYAYLRKRLQSLGTRSAKRKLKSLSGRERRFQRDYNHCLSKRIVNMDYGAFALERLKGIRNGRKGKVFNRMRSNWAYLQFRQFLSYKAENIGKSVILVDPRYTSQRCSKCEFTYKSNRNKGIFHCLTSGFHSSADINASLNISQIG